MTGTPLGAGKQSVEKPARVETMVVSDRVQLLTMDHDGFDDCGSFVIWN